LDDFGHLLNESWQLKRSITQKISNDFIDSVYERGIKAGAIGGKLLGAGGGGFIAFYVNERNRKRLIKQMSDLLHVPFHFDQMGSHIIHYSK
jgi:D-glycero-alpha-D-manno-heptose-7-phosphate kinase